MVYGWKIAALISKLQNYSHSVTPYEDLGLAIEGNNAYYKL